jgi:Holliday junction DNA helicase RuvB
MSEFDRFLTPSFNKEIDEVEKSLRPKTFSEYIGQKKAMEKLGIFVSAAKSRKEPLDHLLMYGPPGLGKTTLAGIISNEMGVNIKVTSGPAIERPGDLASILANLKENDVLFIDEIHRLNKIVEEVLYPAMEDYAIDIIIGKGPSARSIRLDLPKFTLIGATTKAGSLSSPLRDRFGLIVKLDLYDPEELKEIVTRSSFILNLDVDSEAAFEIARRSRGTPRLVNRLLKRVRDYSQVVHDGKIDGEISRKALDMLEIDRMGLDHVDIRLIKSIIDIYDGGPVGIENIASAIGEEKSTIEDVYEPYLMQIGFLQRTPRGRMVTRRAYEYFGLNYIQRENQ